MNPSRALLVCLVGLVLVGLLATDAAGQKKDKDKDKKPLIDKDKLVGTWVATDPETGKLVITIELKKDGKVHRTTVVGGKTAEDKNGTWGVSGDKLQITIDKLNEEGKVVGLTDNEFKLDFDGRAFTYKRKK
jgi:uncharacterized protein (TIGR03066 family)